MDAYTQPIPVAQKQTRRVQIHAASCLLGWMTGVEPPATKKPRMSVLNWAERALTGIAFSRRLILTGVFGDEHKPHH